MAPDALLAGHLAYAVIVAAVAAEGVPGVGLLAPGGIVVVAGGAAAGAGVLNLAGVFVAAAAASFAADAAGFAVGRRLPRRTASARRLPRGALALALAGRFLPPARGVVPLLAGRAGARPRRYLASAAAAALLWASSHALAGYVGVAALLRHGPWALAAAVAVGVVALAALGLRRPRARSA